MTVDMVIRMPHSVTQHDGTAPSRERDMLQKAWQ
jgi:hypothetical protein